MMDAYRVAFNTWQEKTEWVQKDKRFDVLLPWGKHRADVMKEYIDLLESRIEDMAVQLANAESKCRELAAENAGLKATCDDRRTFIMNGVQLGYIKVPTVESDPALETIRVAVSPQEPTPATDSFLAEVLAQGVDASIEHLSKKFEGTGRIGVPVMALEWLAQEIRKGVQS